MRVRIIVDAGERQAEFVREPLTRTLDQDPSAALVDHLWQAYCEAREWLERGLTGEDHHDATT